MVSKLGGASVGKGVLVVFAGAVLTGMVGINGPGSGSLPQLDRAPIKKNKLNNRIKFFVDECFEANSYNTYLKNMRVSPPVKILEFGLIQPQYLDNLPK